MWTCWAELSAEASLLATNSRDYLAVVDTGSWADTCKWEGRRSSCTSRIPIAADCFRNFLKKPIRALNENRNEASCVCEPFYQEWWWIGERGNIILPSMQNFLLANVSGVLSHKRGAYTNTPEAQEIGRAWSWHRNRETVPCRHFRALHS